MLTNVSVFNHNTFILMKKMTLGVVLAFFLLHLSQKSLAQNNQNWWLDQSETALRLAPDAKRLIKASHYRTLQINISELQNSLAAHATTQLSFPLPDGRTEIFSVRYSPVMANDLAKKYPNIRTFAGQSLANPTHSVRFDVTPKGFHALLYLGNETVYIDPYSTSDILNYICYFKKDFLLQKPTSPCSVKNKTDNDLPNDPSFTAPQQQNKKRGGQTFGCDAPLQLRTYRLAVACTGEYAQFHYAGIPADSVAQRKAAVLSAIVTSINRVTNVYERETAVRFILVPNNDTLIYLSAASDPFNNDNSGQLINQSQTVITNIIGNANFDIGHTFSTGGGGLAGLGVVCQNGDKASGITGTDSPIGDPFDIDYVAHEIGHQFGGNHTFNSSTGSCSSNREGSVAYEPASGVTIMAYAGICAPQDLAPNSIDNFHAASLDEILTYINNAEGNNCPVRTGTNTAPKIVSGVAISLTIPKRTPFILDAKATDADGDSLTYCWEQWDLGPQGNINAASTTAPIFRSFSPTLNSFRYFPKLSDILTNTTTYGEVLPTVARTLKFRLTVRDNRLADTGGGGVCWEDYELKVAASGPFLVTKPNAGTEIWKAGGYESVTWDAAQTQLAPVNCPLVNIKLSLDGGQTYPITLATNTPNDGSEYVLAPDTVSTLARVRIEAVGNVFFDISDKNFSIEKPSVPTFSFAIAPSSRRVCLPQSDTILLQTISLLGFDSSLIFKVLSGVPTGATASFSRDTIQPSQTTQLFIDYANVTTRRIDTVRIQAIAAGGDTLLRDIYLQIIPNNFSALQTSQPANGASGVTQLPTFRWNKTPNADSYEIQIATNPAFDSVSIVKNISNLTDTTYTPNNLLEINRLYYWRVRPVNECGKGNFTDISLFHTLSLSCAKFSSGNVPLTISQSGTPTIESSLTVAGGGEISDINVTKLKGSHEFFRDLDVRLVSPQGTEVKLFANVCGNSSGNFDVVMDDQSPTAINCPPTNGKQWKPQELLSAFNGENSSGVWKLRVKDQVASSGGNLTAWELQICGNIAANPPVLVKNDTMPVAPAKDRFVANDFLLATDVNNTAEQLIYTLMRVPRHGFLLRSGSLQAIKVGEKFSQSSLNSNQIRYKNNGNGAAFDDFSFVVEDGEGGWINTTQFNIRMDENAPVGTSETADLANQFYLYPNPTSGDFQLTWKTEEVLNHVTVTIINAQGQIVENVSLVEKNHIFASNLLANGVYFIKIQTKNTNFVKKIVLSK